MAEYLVTDTDMTAVADAIRTKGGTSDALSFPAGFVDAVAAIQAGASSVDADVGEIVLEESSLYLTIPTTQKRKYAVAFLEGNPLTLGLTAYQIYAGLAYCGGNDGGGYGGNLWVNFNGTNIASGGGLEENYNADNAGNAVAKGPVFNEDSVVTGGKISGTTSNVWVAGHVYKYVAWGDGNA